KPYADQLVEELGHQGVKRVAVVSPAFFSDCVETLEEIAIGLNETFQEAGGDQLIALDCLNASGDGMEVLEYFARRELKGWLD
ncbi:MAG: ferrochelatase, partial [Litorivicinaceae bacterium]